VCFSCFSVRNSHIFIGLQILQRRILCCFAALLGLIWHFFARVHGVVWGERSVHASVRCVYCAQCEGNSMQPP
jgi:hypothetical protein